VTDEDGGAFFGELVILFDNFKFGFGAERTGGVVEDEDLDRASLRLWPARFVAIR